MSDDDVSYPVWCRPAFYDNAASGRIVALCMTGGRMCGVTYDNDWLPYGSHGDFFRLSPVQWRLSNVCDRRDERSVRDFDGVMT